MNEETKSVRSEQADKINITTKLKYASIGGAISLVVVGFAGTAYYYGIVKPNQLTFEKAIKKLADPEALLNVPQTTTGKVQEVGSETLKVASTNDGELTINVPQDVPITRKGQPIKLEDVRNEETATLLYRTMNNELRATRIIVR